MAARQYGLLILTVLGSMGAGHRTQNFVVYAPTQEIAQQVGQYAEYYRKQKALEWLGQEMPAWGKPCPLHVNVSMNGSGGATSFVFDQGSILSIDMNIRGSLDRLLASVLPHEVTHTVFAYYYRRPIPRWADEGGSVLSEDDRERIHHDSLVRQILRTPGRAIPLRRLFSLMEYPPDVMVLYAEGYSVTEFLVQRGGRSNFLSFVGQGMNGDWDGALQRFYGYQKVEQLEQAWLQHLRDTPPGRPSREILASNPRQGPTLGSPTAQVRVRQTVPPVQPLDDSPRVIYRGQNSESGWNNPTTQPVGREGYLPDERGLGKVQPVLLPPPPGGARLGTPQFPSGPAHFGPPAFGSQSTGDQGYSP